MYQHSALVAHEKCSLPFLLPFFFSFSDSESIWIVIKNSSVFRLIHLFHIWKLFMCRFWCVLVMQCFQTVLQTKMCCAWVLIYDAWSLGWLFAGSCFSLLILLLFSIIQVIMECLFGSLTSEMDERINSDAPCHFFRGEYFCSDSQQVIVFFSWCFCGQGVSLKTDVVLHWRLLWIFLPKVVPITPGGWVDWLG